MILSKPLILTNKEHRECHELWHRWKAEFGDRVRVVKGLFDLAERSILQKEMPTDPTMWVDVVEVLLDALHFPAHSDLVDRSLMHRGVRSLIIEHEKYGAGSGYAERSVVLGWVVREHDFLLRDLEEVA